MCQPCPGCHAYAGPRCVAGADGEVGRERNADRPARGNAGTGFGHRSRRPADSRAYGRARDNSGTYPGVHSCTDTGYHAPGNRDSGADGNRYFYAGAYARSHAGTDTDSDSDSDAGTYTCTDARACARRRAPRDLRHG